jgi:hypothetical protein
VWTHDVNTWYAYLLSGPFVWLLNSEFGFALPSQTASVLKSCIPWDITPRSPVKLNRRFEGTYRLYSKIQAWSKIANRAAQKVELFIVTAVRTSDPAASVMFYFARIFLCHWKYNALVVFIEVYFCRQLCAFTCNLLLNAVHKCKWILAWTVDTNYQCAQLLVPSPNTCMCETLVRSTHTWQMKLQQTLHFLRVRHRFFFLMRCQYPMWH